MQILNAILYNEPSKTVIYLGVSMADGNRLVSINANWTQLSVFELARHVPPPLVQALVDIIVGGEQTVSVVWTGLELRQFPVLRSHLTWPRPTGRLCDLIHADYNLLHA